MIEAINAIIKDDEGIEYTEPIGKEFKNKLKFKKFKTKFKKSMTRKYGCIVEIFYSFKEEFDDNSNK